MLRIDANEKSNMASPRGSKQTCESDTCGRRFYRADRPAGASGWPSPLECARSSLLATIFKRRREDGSRGDGIDPDSRREVQSG